jgi:hypothetical protein
VLLRLANECPATARGARLRPVGGEIRPSASSARATYVAGGGWLNEVKHDGFRADDERIEAGRIREAHAGFLAAGAQPHELAKSLVVDVPADWKDVARSPAADPSVRPSGVCRAVQQSYGKSGENKRAFAPDDESSELGLNKRVAAAIEDRPL